MNGLIQNSFYISLIIIGVLLVWKLIISLTSSRLRSNVKNFFWFDAVSISSTSNNEIKSSKKLSNRISLAIVVVMSLEFVLIAAILYFS